MTSKMLPLLHTPKEMLRDVTSTTHTMTPPTMAAMFHMRACLEQRKASPWSPCSQALSTCREKDNIVT